MELNEQEQRLWKYNLLKKSYTYDSQFTYYRIHLQRRKYRSTQTYNTAKICIIVL